MFCSQIRVIGVWTFEVSCINWMEKSEVIQNTLQWKYRLISYHIISLVIDITFICFLICIDFTAKYKIKPCNEMDKPLVSYVSAQRDDVQYNVA